jgi:hypothetical protein
MNDISLEWNGDISFGPTGDVATSTGQQMVSQRICRRLLTNTGDYLWQLDYGASLGQFVGTPVDTHNIEAVIRSQIQLESALPKNMTTDVSVSMASNGSGIVSATVLYSDQTAAAPAVVNIYVPRDII